MDVAPFGLVSDNARTGRTLPAAFVVPVRAAPHLPIVIPAGSTAVTLMPASEDSLGAPGNDVCTDDELDFELINEGITSNAEPFVPVMIELSGATDGWYSRVTVVTGPVMGTVCCWA
jgi:hypothetical protein